MFAIYDHSLLHIHSMKPLLSNSFGKIGVALKGPCECNISDVMSVCNNREIRRRKIREEANLWPYRVVVFIQQLMPPILDCSLWGFKFGTSRLCERYGEKVLPNGIYCEWHSYGCSTASLSQLQNMQCTVFTFYNPFIAIRYIKQKQNNLHFVSLLYFQFLSRKR